MNEKEIQVSAKQSAMITVADKYEICMLYMHCLHAPPWITRCDSFMDAHGYSKKELSIQFLDLVSLHLIGPACSHLHVGIIYVAIITDTEYCTLIN